MVDKILNRVVGFMESTGYAVAASRLANMGYHEQAKSLMQEFYKSKENSNA
jgi:hypothetical protein